MGPYSHYILAAKLEPSLQPEQPAAYYWGAVAPDIRYLANLRRDHTHLGQDRILELTACYPHLRSFLLGYQVHVLIDQIDVAHSIGAAFPLNLVQKVRRKKISSQQMTMLVEMYYFQSGISGQPLSGEHNEVLSDLGITSEQTRVFHQGLQEYFDARSLEAAVYAFQKIGMIQNDRLQKYLNAYRTMQKQKVLNFLLILTIKNARLDSRVLDHVRSNI
jgi:hypothetical protein